MIANAAHRAINDRLPGGPADQRLAGSAGAGSILFGEQVGDEGAPPCWLTDAIGWVPEPDADERRRYLMTDANAEMLEQVERYPRIRDRALFIGHPGDLPDASFGADLPDIRTWAADRFTFTGPIADGGVDLVVSRLVELL